MRRFAYFASTLMLGCSLSNTFAAGDITGTGTWSTYQNDRYDFSFRYPPTLQVLEHQMTNDAATGILLRVDIYTRKAQGAPILRVIVARPNGPMQMHETKKFLHDVCEKFEDVRVGNRKGIGCVTCGRGACHWMAHMLGPTEFKVFSMAWDEYIGSQHDWSGASREDMIALSVPKNSPYPIVDMLKSFEFGPSVPESN